MTFKLGIVIEQQGQIFVDPHWSEVTARLIEAQSEDAGEETRLSHLIVCRDDRVIEDNRHGSPSGRRASVSASAANHQCRYPRGTRSGWYPMVIGSPDVHEYLNSACGLSNLYFCAAATAASTHERSSA